MPYKFSVGQSVQYTPPGGKLGLFQVVQRMPIEPQQAAIRYRVKSNSEGFERSVQEFELSRIQPEQPALKQVNGRRSASRLRRLSAS